jgi:hypothetical protein
MPAYTRPAFNAADASFDGPAAYTLPDSDAAHATWYEGDAFCHVAVPGPLGAPAVLTHALGAYVGVPGPLGAPAVLARAEIIARVSVPGPLGAPAVLAFHDFSGYVQFAATRYVCDLVTPGGLVRVPISSWQATLQVDRECYLMAVIPNCGEWLVDVDAATEFVITRLALLPNGQSFAYEMARCTLQTSQTDRGPTNHTCTISGYFAALTQVQDPPPAFDRVLTGIRSISNYDSGTRVRCSIDWTLRPAMRAFYAGSEFIVGYMNLYGTEDDQYMDIGPREVP